MKKLIVYGGSFDPPHNGHLAIAKAAAKSFGCSLCLMPAKRARWKDNEASTEDRLKMASIAADILNKDMPGTFFVSDYEIRQEEEGETHSIDAVRHFAKDYEKLYFIIGADQVALFDKWYKPDEIASLAQIVYFSRPGNEISDSNVAKYHMIKLEMEEYPVSSTQIRNLESIDYPDEIRHYVEAKRLYLLSKFGNYLKPKRLEHSISVANVALKIAINNPEAVLPIEAYRAGLLHDLGKYVNDETAIAMIKENFDEKYIKYPSWAYHQWTGAVIARDVFGEKNQKVLDAIIYHCTGRPKMGPLEQIIYSSDKIDPLRGYDSSPLIESCLNDYHQGFIDVLAANRIYLAEKDLHQDDSKDLKDMCYEYYLDKGEKE